MEVYDRRHKPIILGEKIGQGGEAAVYKVEGHRSLLAKVFEPEPRPNYANKLTWMMAYPPRNPTHSAHHASLAWPVELLYGSNKRLVGYLMPYIRQSVPVLNVFNPRRRAAILPQFNRRYLHRAARNLTAAVAALHQSGYVIGDLNESNTLITPSALVTLIDTDSIQVLEQNNGRLTIHCCPVGKLEYTPPELQGKLLLEVTRLPEHDAFALAVLIFQLLMEGSHPFRAQWLGSGEPPSLEARIRQGLFPYMASPSGPVRPPKGGLSFNHLHPDLIALFKACFIAGHKDPVRRPSSMEWYQSLVNAEENLRQCTRGHFYANHLIACPACAPLWQKTENARAGQSRQTRQAQAKQTAQSTATAGASPSQPYAPLPPKQSTPGRSSSTQSPSGPFGPGQLRRRPFSWGTPASRQRTTSTGAPAYTRSWKIPWQGFNLPSFPWQQPDWLKTWVRPRIYKSFLVGGSLGALVGAIPGALLGLSGWSSGQITAWYLLWALGGATAGLWRGWKPTYRLSLVVKQSIGWERLWMIMGTVVGAIIGGLFGIIFWWAVFPIFLGLIGGARLGGATGQKIWLAGSKYGWDRIGALMGSVTLALMGSILAGLVASTGIGSFTNQSAISLAVWLLDNGLHLLFIGGLIGALGGACGGAIGGIFSDLVTRLAGLVD